MHTCIVKYGFTFEKQTRKLKPNLNQHLDHEGHTPAGCCVLSMHGTQCDNKFVHCTTRYHSDADSSATTLQILVRTVSCRCFYILQLESRLQQRQGGSRSSTEQAATARHNPVASCLLSCMPFQQIREACANKAAATPMQIICKSLCL